jgi:hypothetical protein
MKKFYATICLFVAFTVNAMAINYIVSGDPEFEGTYVETGTCNGKPAYLMSKNGNDYSIAWNGFSWTLGQTFGGPCSNFENYRNNSNTATPPATGWSGCCNSITVLPEGRSISISTNTLVESSANNGVLVGSILIRNNKFNNDVFTGTDGENYVTNNKVSLNNVPAGLTPVVIKNNDSTLTLSFIGSANNHTTLNDANISLYILNTAVSGGDTSLYSGNNFSLLLNFRSVLTVAANGADFTTIADAISAGTTFDIIDIWPGTYTEFNLTVPNGLIFKGHGADNTIIQAASSPNSATDRVFNITGFKEVEFHDLTIRYGKVVAGNGQGAGINSSSAKITLYNCSVTGNYALSTGAGGASFGGGIYCSNGLFIYSSLISNNTAQSTSGNSYGGGIYSYSTVLNNSTITGNSVIGLGSQVYGGGLNSNGGTVTVTNTTISNNSSNTGSGIFTYNGAVTTLKNSIVYGNIGGKDLDFGNSFGGIDYNVYNSIISSNSSSVLDGVVSNHITLDPLLSPLANNGGTTQTMALQPGSPAINAGISGADIPTTDQRGFYNNGIKDIGAFEYRGCAPAIILNVNTAICYNDSVLLGGSYQTIAGTYADTIRTAFGCDSIITNTALTIYTIDTTTATPINICEGGSYNFYGNNITNAGIYYHTLTNSVTGCDSIIELTLSVNLIDSTSSSVAICEGGSYNFYGTSLTNAGIYYHTLTNSVTGCDSIIELVLTVDTLDLTTNLSNDIITVLQGGANYQWIDCSTNTAINGENGQYFIVTQVGNYAVVISNGSCSDTSACINVFTTSIKSASLEAVINIYPNPNNGSFTLSNLNAREEYNIEVKDVLGRTVYTDVIKSNSSKANIKLNQATGVYWLQITSKQGGTKVHKIVVE